MSASEEKCDTEKIVPRADQADLPADGCVFAENSHVLLAVRLQPHGHPAPGSDGIRGFFSHITQNQAGRAL